MKKKLLLLGAGGLGRVVLEHAMKEYDCAFLDDGIVTETIIDDVPVIGKSSDMEYLFGEYKQLVVTIGNNHIREELYKKALIIGYDFPNIIASSAYISPHSTVGNGCIVLNNAVVQNHSECGNGCILNAGVELHHDSKIGDFCLIYTNSVIRSLTNVGDRVWIGSTSTVSTYVTVPDDTVIADGTVYDLK